ncbi:uncharacterized protein LOC62_01G000237 [Vanrija pseudolonga]|uniref:TRP C-terminal domain-containing protein n=1 Tax=Vanrija pseudolonga TaxID=143232 RepID=A0AAF0XZ22_9TREE|nr:hypothetical protein LOC62_01G000237 [Vanrija pseudolonga]
MVGAAVFLWALVLARTAAATVLVSAFSDCSSLTTPIAPPSQRLAVSDVFVQLVKGDESLRLGLNGGGVDVLRLDVIGTSPSVISGYNNNTQKLATIFTTTQEAGVVQFRSTGWLCNSLFPANLTSEYIPGNMTYCPLPAGPFGINASIPLYNVHALTTIHARIHVVETSEPAQTTMCVDVYVTPYDDGSWPYKLFLWFPASLAIAFWIVTWAARFAAGWLIGADRRGSGQREAAMLKWGTMLISGLSGERLGVSAALLRFVTPGLRDILHHIQFVTMLGMIAVSWPSFFYPIVAQSAWADLLWNATIVSSNHTQLFPDKYTPPENFAPQMTNTSYPLYLNSTATNKLLNLNSTRDGMDSFAFVVGLRPQDLFGTCLSLFLMLAGVIIIVSLLLWIVHGLAEWFSKETKPVARPPPRPGPRPYNTNRSSYMSSNGGHSNGHSRSSSNAKEWYDPRGSQTEFGQVPLTPASMTPRAAATPVVPSKFRRIWSRFTPRGEAGAFHFAALYGNLLRLIIAFHFPVTAVSVYHLTLQRTSIVSKVFAALSFAFISVAIPTFIMYKISRTPTGKLYEAARTLLGLGPIYNVYEQEKQLYRTLPLVGSLLSGIAIGAGQDSGLAQTIVLIVVELVVFLATAVWSPWGQGAGMGGTVIFTSIARISSIVLAMILAPNVSVEEGSQQWLAYVVLILQALVFIFYFFMVLVKILEGLIRLFGGGTFDESNHPIDGGIFAAIMDLDCLNGVRGGKAAARKKRKRDSRQLQRNVSVAGSLTTQMMLDRHSQGVERQLGGYTRASMHAQRGYYQVSNPSVDHLGRRSMSDQGSIASMSDENRIMDMWRRMVTPTHGYSDIQPLASPSEKSPVNSPRRHSTGWPQTAPLIRVSEEKGSSYKPQHSRAHSSSAIVEELASPTSPVPPPIRSMSTSPRLPPHGQLGVPTTPTYPPARGIRPDNNGVRPPPLTISKRRSLNNIAIEEEEAGAAEASKRRSAWFGRSGADDRTRARRSHDDDDSDDEPGPRRPRRRYRNQRQQGVDPETSPRAPRGFKALFTRKAKLDERTRDENSARKAAKMNESAAIFTGVEAPSQNTGNNTFRVQRKNQPAARPVSGASGSAVPLLAAPPPSSFKVARMRQSGPSPGRTPPMVSPSPSALEALQNVAEEPQDAPALHVNRQLRPSPSGSSMSSLQRTPDPAVPAQQSSGGYATNLFVPLRPGG